MALFQARNLMNGTLAVLFDTQQQTWFKKGGVVVENGRI